MKNLIIVGGTGALAKPQRAANCREYPAERIP